MSVLFANGVRTSLTASVGTGDTSIAVGAATGMPAAGGGDYFMLRLTNVNTMAYEIVKVTGLSGTTLTVLRAQEGTTALAFVAGDRVELRLTAGTLDAIRDELQVNIDAVEQVATDALALANSVFPNPRYVARIDQWLAETIAAEKRVQEPPLNRHHGSKVMEWS